MSRTGRVRTDNRHRYEDAGIEAPVDLKERGLTQRDALLEICDRAEIWRSLDGDTFATIFVDGHLEHQAINSNPFRDWMLGELARGYTLRGRPASAGEAAVRDARMALEAKAHVNRVHLNAPLRISQSDEAIHIDLGSDDWSAIEVTAEDWRAVATPPSPIIRSKRTAAFPLPITGDGFGALRQQLSYLPEDDFIMFTAWCLGASAPRGPYPILILSGEQGSGKSTLARLAQRLTDPVTGDLLQPPGDDRDLIAAARHNRVLAFDNFSGIRADLADSLCRLASGSEIGGRALFSNHDTATFSACRPLVLNGIPDLAARGDLADRSIVLKLDSIAARKTEREWTREVEAALPSIFAALLDALVVGLRRFNDTETPNMRMADFAKFIVAAEPALPWAEGKFLRAYRQNQQRGLAGLTEGDLVAKLVIAFAGRHSAGWNGLMSELYDALSRGLSPDARRSGDWPGNPRWFADRLRRAAPGLRALGIDVRDRRGSEGTKVFIGKIAPLATPATQHSPHAGPESDASVASDARISLSDSAVPSPAEEARTASAEDNAVEFEERAAIPAVRRWPATRRGRGARRRSCQQMRVWWTGRTVYCRLQQAVGARSNGNNDNETELWLSWLDPPHRELVRARASGTPWKMICWRFDISRPTAYRRWRHALGLIAWRLNGKVPPTGCSRRRFMKIAAEM
jgi:hypothetical protein